MFLEEPIERILKPVDTMFENPCIEYVRDPENSPAWWPPAHLLASWFLGPRLFFYRDIPTFFGLQYKGIYMGCPYPNFCLCAFLGALK